MRKEERNARGGLVVPFTQIGAYSPRFPAAPDSSARESLTCRWTCPRPRNKGYSDCGIPMEHYLRAYAGPWADWLRARMDKTRKQEGS